MSGAHDRLLPAAVYVMAFALFAMGSAEFLLAGLLPEVADGVDVSLARVGGLITSFAVGVVLGGPVFALVGSGWPRRSALVAAQAVFATAIGLGLLVETYTALLLTRFVAGVAYAGFFAVAAVTAVTLVDRDRAARASGVVVSGLSLAIVVGGPAGTYLGYRLGWQSAFWVVVGLTVAAAVVTALVAPAERAGARRDVATEVASVRHRGLWWVLLATLLSTAAYMVTYNYLSEVLRTETGLGDLATTATLVLFGVGAWLGLAVGGRVADARPHSAFVAGALGVAVGSVALALATERAVVAVAAVAVLGFSGFVLNPAVYGRVFSIAGTATTLPGALTVSSFQLGISLVPLLGAVVLGAGRAVSGVAWLGAVLAVAAVPAVLAERSTARRTSSACTLRRVRS